MLRLNKNIRKVLKKLTYRSMKLKLIIISVVCLVQSSFVLHPLKMSVGDITYKDKALHLKFKFFTDDLESTLQQFSKGPLGLVNKGVDANSEKWIQKYVGANFSMQVNGEPLKWVYKKSYTVAEKEGVVFVEYQAKYDKVNSIELIRIKNILLFDGIPEQKNIVNINLLNEIKVLQFENGSEEYSKEVKYDLN